MEEEEEDRRWRRRNSFRFLVHVVRGDDNGPMLAGGAPLLNQPI